MDVALIAGGIVGQVWRDTDIATLVAAGVSDIGLVEFEAAGAVCGGMAWDGEVLSLPTPPPPTADQLKAYAASKRYQVEIGGIVFGGMPVWTDRATQSMLGRVLDSLDRGFVTAPLNVKTPAGFVPLSQAQIDAIAGAVAQHVQASFDAEEAVFAAIDAETITTKAEIDAAAWPANT